MIRFCHKKVNRPCAQIEAIQEHVCRDHSGYEPEPDSSHHAFFSPPPARQHHLLQMPAGFRPEFDLTVNQEQPENPQ